MSAWVSGLLLIRLQQSLLFRKTYQVWMEDAKLYNFYDVSRTHTKKMLYCSRDKLKHRKCPRWQSSLLRLWELTARPKPAVRLTQPSHPSGINRNPQQWIGTVAR